MAIGVGQTGGRIFTLQNQDKKEVKLSDFAGKKKCGPGVVPRWTGGPTCTNEHALLR